MYIPIPFCDRARIRAFERVEADARYDIVDVGLEYKDGSRDTIAIGGAFHSLKEWTSKDSKGDTPSASNS